MSMTIRNAKERLRVQREIEAVVWAVLHEKRHLVSTKALTLEITPEDSASRYTARRRTVRISHPGSGLTLSIDLDGNGLRSFAAKQVFVLSWHGVRDPWKLSGAFAQSVNTHHRHKATDTGEGVEALKALLRERIASILDGRAFAWELMGDPWAESNGLGVTK